MVANWSGVSISVPTPVAMPFSAIDGFAGPLVCRVKMSLWVPIATGANCTCRVQLLTVVTPPLQVLEVTL